MLCVLAAGAQAPVVELQLDNAQEVPSAQAPAGAIPPGSAPEVPYTDQAPAEATEAVSTQLVPYLSGGIGGDDREQLTAAASDYNLKLVFAESGGAYVADVLVTIKNGEGSTLLDTNSTGPLFFPKLPAGEYRVEASYRGAMKTSSTSVLETGQQVLDFRW